ncbi:BMP/retinoic acid-inducible neural-specific protein 3 [Dissostichus eleginoides]|nr:BMP/retinoic acid-inducible neural-specific protein 3 [Dissostichus eleginoides]
MLMVEFSHWKVNSLATEKRDFLKAPLPLAPEFLRNLRLLGRRPTLQQINENLIKKYGTHFLVSATLGDCGISMGDGDRDECSSRLIVRLYM